MYSIGIPQRSEKVNRFFLKLDKYRASKGIPLKALFNEKQEENYRHYQKTCN